MGDSLFSENKTCPHCGRRLPNDYRFELCTACEEYELFDKVRDYIRSNQVTEADVAEHFKIPLRKVRAWIREGRIEYSGGPSTIQGTRCKGCGRRINLGEYCPQCMRNGGASIYFDRDFKL